MQLVVIGSSAGGIEALTRLVADVPGDFDAAIVIAQHLDPRRPSHLAEILERHATLPVRVVADGDPLSEGVIHVVPPNRLVEVVGDAVRLRRVPAETTAPSIDRLLTSAAKAFGERAIAVILTGTGADGSAGAWEVKRAGGAVVIENPETAAFPSMPAAVSPSHRRRAGRPRGDGRRAGGPHRGHGRPGRCDPRPGGPGDADAYAALLERIRSRSGIDYAAYKSATIQRRLRGRMSATASATVADYAALVERDPVEYDRLVDSLLIKVTEFFRDGRMWDHLRSTVLPALVAEARNEARELRIWSAGCSTGEEAYSVAIAAAEAARSGGTRSGDPRLRDGRRPDRDRLRPPRRLPARRLARPPGTAARALLQAVRRGLRGHPAGPVPDGLRRARPERARAVPADRPAPVPERPDLLHRAAPAGRPGDLRLLPPPGRTARPRHGRDRRRAAGTVC